MDFLWMLLLAMLKRIGIDEFASAISLNLLSALLLLSILNTRKEHLPIYAACLIFTPYLFSIIAPIFIDILFLYLCRMHLFGNK